MSDLSTANCGCGCEGRDRFGGDCGCGGCSCGCNNSGCGFGNNSCLWIILLLCCCGGFGNGWSVMVAATAVDVDARQLTFPV